MESKVVKVPFRPDFKDAVLGGVKTCTTRTRKLGDVGDRFSAFGAVFEITAVEERSLESVADELWHEEGCTSPEHFMEIWVELHPRRGWKGSDIRFTHHFTKIGEEPKPWH